LNDRLTEDVDAVFFDAEGDGDSDLYIVRGGNEFPAGNPMLADRLLLNDGYGGFEKSTPGALPYMPQNGSCIRPSDYDMDGDMDLFVGARSVPGAYGISPQQTLLENDGTGKFTRVPEQKTGGLTHIGMVTDACWVDYDLDGDPDLVVVGEWMNITLYQNHQGQFTNITKIAGLDHTSGWWNCISVADVDMDGDPDLIGGNLGLNTFLKASIKEPVEMYVADFDNNGSPDQVICTYQNGVSLPIATLDELDGHINGLKRKYPSYAEYAGKTAAEIFGAEKLDQSLYRSAVRLESSLFINNGDGTFEIKNLPGPVQFSPVRDLIVDDFNLDGIPDLLLVGNNYQVRPSLGRIDASHGLLMLGAEGQQFKTLLPSESGIQIKGEAIKIESILIHNSHFNAIGVNNHSLHLMKLHR
jgi:hypothetical protein